MKQGTVRSAGEGGTTVSPGNLSDYTYGWGVVPAACGEYGQNVLA